MRNSSYWIKRLNLKPHPEGGFFRECYRSDQTGSFDAFPGMRNISTGAYYLLEKGHISHLHRIKSDEQWFFLAGDPLRVVTISNTGSRLDHLLGSDDSSSLHAVVPAGSWFGACLESESDYALVGLVVAPGFDFSDLELASRNALVQQFPQHSAIIDRLSAGSARGKK